MASFHVTCAFHHGLEMKSRLDMTSNGVIHEVGHCLYSTKFFIIIIIFSPGGIEKHVYNNNKVKGSQRSPGTPGSFCLFVCLLLVCLHSSV